MSSSTSLPPAPSLTPATLPPALDALFEPCPALHALVLAAALLPQESYSGLITAVTTLLLNLHDSHDDSTLLPILAAHPRLGAKQVDSAASQAEQKSLAAASVEEAGRLAALNEEYEARFPGLRYVVFVNGRSRAVVMEDMRRRIDAGDGEAEKRTAIEAMRDIAFDRAGKLGVL